MDSFTIDRFTEGEEARVYELIRLVFDEFVAPDYSPAGNNFFYQYIDPVKLAKRFSNGCDILTAKSNGKIVGMIELRDQNHICLLFVHKLWHGKGIAKKLVENAVALCREKNSCLQCLEVNASPYSEKIYAKMGFVKTAEMQNVNGLKFVPMLRMLYSAL